MASMDRVNRLRRVLATVGIGVALLIGRPATPAAGQSTPDIAVVVNQDVKVDNLTRAELRRVLLGDREFWPSGVRVALLIRAPIARERDAALKDICQMTEAQFRTYWISKVFRAEIGSGPKIMFTPQMALEQVARTSGAITFVETPVTVTGVKVLRIDGKAPGQAGYAVK